MNAVVIVVLLAAWPRAGRPSSCSVVPSRDQWLNRVAEVALAGVLGLITIAATRQLASVLLVAQLSLVPPPVPSSQVMKTAVVPLRYSLLFRIAGEVAGHPAVALGDRAVVHVIDQVGRDERERRQTWATAVRAAAGSAAAAARESNNLRTLSLH